MWMQEEGSRGGRHVCITTQVFSGNHLQFMLEWAIVQLVRSQGVEWKVFFASHAFHRDTLDEVVELTSVNVVSDITTVAGTANGNAKREMLQQG
jgi:hypothetical protein